MNVIDDLDRADCLGRIAALIGEKRRTRVKLALGSIDAEAAEALVRSADDELARQWNVLRRSQLRSTSARSRAV